MTGIPLASGFDLNSPVPLDSRTQVTDLTARDAIPNGKRYEGLVVYDKGGGKHYTLKGGIANTNWKEVVTSEVTDALNTQLASTQKKSKKVYNIIGDGLTDNTEELITAIAQGGSISISGEIITSSRIEISNPINITGELGNIFRCRLSIVSDNVTIDGLNFRDTSFVTDQMIICGTAGMNASNLTVRNCTFENVRGIGLEVSCRFGTVENILLENLRFRYCSVFGIILNGFNGKTHPGNNPSIFKNVRIHNCDASYCGSDAYPWSVGIDICEQIDILENCVVSDCTANYNYQSGFHMESFPVKKDVVIINCTAIGNGTGTIEQKICSGFACVNEGVTLINCYAKDNKVSDYHMSGDEVRTQYSNGTILTCKEDTMIINWNELLAKEVYSSKNLIPNGDFKYGSMFYDLSFRDYAITFYHRPCFMRKINGALKSVVREEYLNSITEGITSKRYIHGAFATGMFKLEMAKTYTLKVLIDSRYNSALATISALLVRYNIVSSSDPTLNQDTHVINLGSAIFTHNDTEITEYSLQIGAGTSTPLPADGYYNMTFGNSSTDEKVNRIYNLSLTENDTTLTNTLTWNPDSLVDGVGIISPDIIVNNANVGDFVLVSSPYDLQGVTCTAYISATNTVKIRLQNETGSVVDLPSGTWKVKVIK